MNRNSAAIKIAHITTATSFRGGERQLLWLHEELLKKNVSSFLLYRKKSCFAGKQIPSSCAHGITNYINVSGFIISFFIILRINPDILHCHDSISFTFGSIANIFLKKKIIMTRRTIFPIRRTLFNRWKYKRCNKIVAISNAVSKQCKKLYTDVSVSIIPSCVKPDIPKDDRKKKERIFWDT
jgi:glycosyltransferase involved in cell wall biosynthesis